MDQTWQSLFKVVVSFYNNKMQNKPLLVLGKGKNNASLVKICEIQLKMAEMSKLSKNMAEVIILTFE